MMMPTFALSGMLEMSCAINRSGKDTQALVFESWTSDWVSHWH